MLPMAYRVGLRQLSIDLEGAASLRLAPCHTAAARPARSPRTRGTADRSCGDRVAEPAPLAAPV
jgi:hypothetical protein